MPPRKPKASVPPLVKLSTLKPGDTFLFPDSGTTGRVLREASYSSIRVQLTWAPKTADSKPVTRTQNIAPGAEVVHTGHQAGPLDVPLDEDEETP